MKILCVIDTLTAGGAQRQLVELAIGFKDRGHDVSFLTYHYKPFFQPTLDKVGIATACIEEPNYFRRLMRMRRFIRAGNYDGVVSFLQAANFICELSGLPQRKWKLVVGERSADPKVLTTTKLKMYRLFHLLADFVVSNSEANIEIVRCINPWLSSSKCKVIYNAVNLAQWKPAPDYVPRKNGKLKLTVAAGHVYMKNLDGLLEAIRLLDFSERSQLMVEWYGEIVDNSYSEGQRKIKDYKLESVVSLYSETHEITQRIQESDVVGLFSYYEGFPNVVCEGMSCAKPVICSVVSDVPAFLSCNPDLLCDPRDPHSIKSAISYALSLRNDELMHLGEQNRICAESVFRKEEIVLKYLELLG